VAIMSNNKDDVCESRKKLKAQLTFINKEFEKEMMKEHFKNYLEYVSNGKGNPYKLQANNSILKGDL